MVLLTESHLLPLHSTKECNMNRLYIQDFKFTKFIKIMTKMNMINIVSGLTLQLSIPRYNCKFFFVCYECKTQVACFYILLSSHLYRKMMLYMVQIIYRLDLFIRINFAEWVFVINFRHPLKFTKTNVGYYQC